MYIIPDWVMEKYLADSYITAKPLQTESSGTTGMRETLFVAVRGLDAEQPYMIDFI